MAQATKRKKPPKKDPVLVDGVDLVVDEPDDMEREVLVDEY
jgi:hypothetical protein